MLFKLFSLRYDLEKIKFTPFSVQFYVLKSTYTCICTLVYSCITTPQSGYTSSVMPKNSPVPFCSQPILPTSTLTTTYLFSDSQILIAVGFHFYFHFNSVLCIFNWSIVDFCSTYFWFPLRLPLYAWINFICFAQFPSS